MKWIQLFEEFVFENSGYEHKKLSFFSNDILESSGKNGVHWIQEDLRRPLEKLLTCQFTVDGKSVIYEGQAFSCSTGEKIPLNEEWSLSDLLHTGADIISAGMDFIVPGSGAVVDILNALSYIIEAEFVSEKERDSMYLMAIITFGFVLLPGPLQSISIPLKKALKTGVGMTSKTVLDGLKVIGNSLDVLLVGIPPKVNSALKSPLAKDIMGKWSNKISGLLTNFTKRIKELLSPLKPQTKESSTQVGLELKNIIKNYAKHNQDEFLSPKSVEKFTKIFSKVNELKPAYISKYGERSYHDAIATFLLDGIDEKTLLQKLSNVKNPSIKLKPIFAGGQDHRIFQSVTNPDKVIKAEMRKGEVDKWYDTFNKYPDFFAKTFRKTTVKDGDKVLNAVVMEKLNTRQFMEMWDEIEKLLHSSQKNSKDLVSLEHLLKNLNGYPRYKFLWAQTIKEFKNKFPNQGKKIDEFNSVIKKWFEIIESPDIRKFNLGYDSNGKLKVLDL